MRYTFAASLVMLVLGGGCTQQSEGLCCLNEAECSTVGLDEPVGCADGLLCRGNLCIAEVCAGNDDCDAAASLCAADFRCGTTCADDTQCPGFGGSDAPYCIEGECVQCVASTDCGADAPVCVSGRCEACTEDSQCASGVCVDNRCPTAAEISYVAPNAEADATCTQDSPCGFAKAAAAVSTRPIMLVMPGDHVLGESVTFAAAARVIGRGTPRPTVRNSTATGIIRLAPGLATYTFENLELTAADGRDESGSAIRCDTGSTLRLINARISNSRFAAVNAHGCFVDAMDTEFDGNSTVFNGFNGMFYDNFSANADRCYFTNNGTALQNVRVLTNSFVTRNERAGHIAATSGAVFAHNTIADNGEGPSCSDVALEFSIISRNGGSPTVQNCNLDTSLVDANILALKFVRPDVAPYDYHLMPGSSAIDQAPGSTMAIDIDGEARPKGAARDVGADEAN